MNLLNKPLFSITIRHYKFHPTLIPLIVTLATLSALLALGSWQLDRAEYKEKLEQMIAERIHQTPIPLSSAPQESQQQLYLPVSVKGDYDSAHNILLDNRVYDMQAGYNVFTPLKISQQHGILINRGWVPLGRDRQILPEIKTGTQYYSLQGVLLDPPTTNALGIQLKENYQQWPVVVQSVNLKEIEQQLGYTLEPKILTLSDHAQSGFKRKKIPITLNMSSDRHIGYAITWFLCAIVLFILFIVASSQNESKNNDK